MQRKRRDVGDGERTFLRPSIRIITRPLEYFLWSFPWVDIVAIALPRAMRVPALFVGKEEQALRRFRQDVE